MAGVELFELWLGSPGARLATPGRVLRLLSETLGIAAEAVDAITPLARGRMQVAIHRDVSLPISTPMNLPSREEGAGALWVLKRPTDPMDTDVAVIRLEATGATLASPGAICRALSEAFGPALGGEDCGLSFVGERWIRVELPAHAIAFRTPPTTLNVGSTSFHLTASVGEAGL